MISFRSPCPGNPLGTSQTRFAGQQAHDSKAEKGKKSASAAPVVAIPPHRQLRRQDAFILLDGEVFPKGQGLRFEHFESRPDLKKQDEGKMASRLGSGSSRASDTASLTSTEVDSDSEGESPLRSSDNMVYTRRDRQREIREVTQRALEKFRTRRPDEKTMSGPQSAEKHTASPGTKKP